MNQTELLGKLSEIKDKIQRKFPSWLNLLLWKAKMFKMPGQRVSYITCAGKTDGIGAQAQAVLSTMLFAKEFGLIYAHTPFQEIAHNIDKAAAARKWEDFLGLGQGEIRVDDLNIDQLNVVSVDSPKQIRNIKNTLYVIKHCHDFADEFPNCYSKLERQILQKYGSLQRDVREVKKQPGQVNVSIHIRRGDVDSSRGGRFTDNKCYYNILTDILSVLDSLQLSASIHLYSQGVVEDFSELREFNLSYHLDECPFETFHHLVSTDLLVMSKSSFSYSAALLSSSIKLYQPFWHKPLADWIVVDTKSSNTQANFDKSRLSKQLATIVPRPQ